MNDPLVQKNWRSVPFYMIQPCSRVKKVTYDGGIYTVDGKSKLIFPQFFSKLSELAVKKTHWQAESSILRV